MKLRKTTLFALATAAYLIPVSGLRGMTPANFTSKAEVVATVNVRALADSEISKAVLEANREDAVAKMEVMKNLSGIDILTDVDRITATGNIEDPDSVTILFQGRFDADKLTALAKAAPDSTSYEHGGYTVHEWTDKGSQNKVIGSILDSGSVAFWKSRQTMERSIDSGKFAANGYPQDALFWVSVRPDRNSAEFEKVGVEGAIASAVIAGDNLEVTVKADALTTEAAAKWAQVAQGAIAFAQLQTEEPELKKLASQITVNRDESGKSVEVEFAVPVKDITLKIHDPLNMQKVVDVTTTTTGN